MPRRGESLRALAVAATVAAVCWYFGVNVWHALLLGCAITVAALALMLASSAPELSELDWRAGRNSRSDGSRTDIVRLSAALRGGWGPVSLTAERQLRNIARTRLALEGLELANPEHRHAIELHIGTSAYRILTRTSPRRVRMRTLISCLDALDALNPTYYPAPRRRSWGRARAAGSDHTPGRTH